jgi:hypothetical protein
MIFRRKGKITKERSSSLHAYIQSQIRLFDKLVVRIEAHKGARVHKMTSHFDAITLAAVLFPFKNGFEEQLLQLCWSKWRTRRKSVEASMIDEAIYVRDHAIKRFHERSGELFSGKILWPALSLIPAIELYQKPCFTRSFCLPVKQGLFLGLFILRPWTQQVEVGLVDKSGLSERKRNGNVRFGDWIINTFISFDEMREEQMLVHQETSRLLNKHEPWLRILSIAPLFSPEESENEFRFDGDLEMDVEGAEAEFRQLLWGRNWEVANPLPADSVFEEALNEQRRLERYGADVLLRARGVDPEKLAAHFEGEGFDVEKIESFLQAEMARSPAP